MGRSRGASGRPRLGQVTYKLVRSLATVPPPRSIGLQLPLKASSLHQVLEATGKLEAQAGYRPLWGEPAQRGWLRFVSLPERGELFPSAFHEDGARRSALQGWELADRLLENVAGGGPRPRLRRRGHSQARAPSAIERLGGPF